MEEAEGNIDAARTICMAGIAKYERGLLQRSSARSQKAQEGDDGSEQKELLSSADSGRRLHNMQHMMRRDPWHMQIFGGSAKQRSNLHAVRLPVEEKVARHKQVEEEGQQNEKEAQPI
jgi:hypothetical protein